MRTQDIPVIDTGSSSRLAVHTPKADSAAVIGELPMFPTAPIGFVSNRWQTNQRTSFVREELDLTVEGANVETLLMEVSGGSRISGVVSIEGNRSSPQFVRVDANRLKGNAASSIRLDETGKFALTAVPAGEITLSAFPSPQDKFFVKSIEANGLDLLRTNLTIAEGEEIKDARIVISPNLGVLAGRVLSLKGDKPTSRVPNW